MKQTTLEGVDLKELGTMAALSAIPEWAERARETALALLRVQGSITAEDVTDIVGLPRRAGGVNRNNAVGALFTCLRRQNLIRNAGWTQARNPQAHARTLRKWTLNKEGEQ